MRTARSWLQLAKLDSEASQACTGAEGVLGEIEEERRAHDAHDGASPQTVDGRALMEAVLIKHGRSPSAA